MTEKEDFFESFSKQKFKDRESVVILKKFGDTADDLEWHIRGLNATDLERVDAAEIENGTAMALMEAAVRAAGSDPKAKKELLESMFGTSDEVPGSLIRKYVVFELGSIPPNKPKDRIQDTIKFADAYPVEFRNIVNHILGLTGMGQVSKKKPLPPIENLATT